ncbi:MAG: hypothetical protein Q9187_003726 [Circinaria calcarea]
MSSTTTTTSPTMPSPTCSYFSNPAGLPDYVLHPCYARYDYPNLPPRLTVLPDLNADFIAHLRARNSSRRAPSIDSDHHINIITARMEEIALRRQQAVERDAERSVAPAEGSRYSSLYARMIAEENAVKKAAAANAKAHARKRLGLSELKGSVKRHSAAKPAPATVATRVATPYPSVVQRRACVAQPRLETEVVSVPASGPASFPVAPVRRNERVWKERAAVRRSTPAPFVQENGRVWWTV